MLLETIIEQNRQFFSLKIQGMSPSKPKPDCSAYNLILVVVLQKKKKSRKLL